MAFLTTHENLLGSDDELIVLHVHAPLSPRAQSMLPKSFVEKYNSEESEKVIAPIKRFLDRHSVRYSASWVVGRAAEEIAACAKREKVHMIVMGTHGYGLAGRMLMGSVAQKVIASVDVPVLLVK